MMDRQLDDVISRVETACAQLRLGNLSRPVSIVDMTGWHGTMIHRPLSYEWLYVRAEIVAFVSA